MSDFHYNTIDFQFNIFFFTFFRWQDKPCCRLKYKAIGSTWMEIFYTMQYGPNDFKNGPIYDIIEVHRFIKLYNGAFAYADQEDWPKNGESIL